MRVVFRNLLQAGARAVDGVTEAPLSPPREAGSVLSLDVIVMNRFP